MTDSLYKDHVAPLIGESHLDDQEWWVGLTVLVFDSVLLGVPG